MHAGTRPAEDDRLRRLVKDLFVSAVAIADAHVPPSGCSLHHPFRIDHRASPTKLFCTAAIRSSTTRGKGPLLTAAAAYSRCSRVEEPTSAVDTASLEV